MRAKHIIGNFEGGQDFFDPLIVRAHSRPISGSKKSRPPPLKNLEKLPIMSFVSIQKITSKTI
jgi:hypothetical protein